MYRLGSKDTCAVCFYIVDGRHNSYILDNFGITFREGQRIFASKGTKWYGTPGDVASRLRKVRLG